METLIPRIAVEADSSRLIKFYSQFPLQGPAHLRIERQGSYFSKYRMQSPNFETHILEDRNQKLQGCATMVFRKGMISGSPQNIGYATDLRIAANRTAIRSWAEHFVPVLEDSLKRHDTEFLFSLFSPDDPTIQNALVAPRALRRNIPIYHLIRRYEIVVIVGRISSFSDPLKSLNIERGKDSDLESLVDFLNRKRQMRTMAFEYSQDLLQYRLKTWTGFAMANFLVARDKRGNIVGCVAPVHNGSFEKLYVEKYEGFALSFQPILRIGSWIGSATRLPSRGGILNVEYLTHFAADNPDVFETLLERCYHEKATDSILLYSHFFSNPLTLAPRHFLTSQIASALYAIAPRSKILPREILHSPLEMPPEIELVLA